MSQPDRIEEPRVRRAKLVRFVATLGRVDRISASQPDEAAGLVEGHSADLDDLASAAQPYLAAPASRFDPVLVLTPLPRRLLAAVIDGLVIVVAGAFCALLLTMLVWAPLLGTDFDGPRQVKALGAWLLQANGLVLALLYTAAGAFGRPTPGRKALDLRLVLVQQDSTPHLAVQASRPPSDPTTPGDAPPAAPGKVQTWRFRLRWVLASLPLIAMTLACAAGALRTAALGIEAFDAISTHPGSHPDSHLALLGVLLSLYWLAGFLWAWADDGQTFWDRLSRIEVRHAMPPLPIQDRRRGFDVVLARAAP